MDVRAARLVTLLLAVAGCSSGVDDADGGGRDDAAGDAGAAHPPEILWLADGLPDIAPPALTPCPEGWREAPPDVAGDPITCDPYPEGGALDCPVGQAHFPGEPGCVPVGSPCPSGEFSDVLPVDRSVVWVRPGAVGDGTSPTSPYGRVTEFSIATLPVGTVIALSRGTHLGPVRLARAAALWGACAAETRLTTSEPDETDGVVTIIGAAGELHDLTVADSPRPGLRLSGDDAEARIEGVLFERLETVAMNAASGAQLTIHRTVVRGTAGRSRDGAFGFGLSAALGSTADVRRTSFEANHSIGLFFGAAGTAATLVDVVIRDTLGHPSAGTDGRGVSVVLGATADFSRVLLDTNRDVAVLAGDMGSAVTLTEALVRDTQPQNSDGRSGRGLGVQDGASAAVSRVVFERNHESSVFGGDAGTALMLSDVLVRDTRGPAVDDAGTRSLNLQVGASADLTRVVMARSEGGVFASGPGTALLLADVIVRDNRGRDSDSSFGRALSAQRGPVVDVIGALFEANNETGVHASDSGTTVTMSEIAIRDTSGRGINVQLDATAMATRALLESNGELGVYAQAAELALTDVVVRDNDGRRSAGEPDDGTLGRGLSVQGDATADVVRAAFANNREVGVYAGDAGTELRLSDVVVRDTHARRCAETTCAGFPAGHGVGSYRGASVSMERFVVTGSALCGIHLGADGEIDSSNGEVRGQPIGVCLASDGYDTSRLTENVRFDNDTNLQATTLPLPEMVDPLEAAP